MKIRTDFVTNSSSSSFIIQQCDKYPDVFSVAEAMIPCRDWDEDVKDLETLKNSNIDRNTNVVFNSCNYRTDIVKDGDNFYVDTCNNHSWNFDYNYVDYGYFDSPVLPPNVDCFLVSYGCKINVSGCEFFVIDCSDMSFGKIFAIINNKRCIFNDEYQRKNDYEEKSFNYGFSKDKKYIILNGDIYKNKFDITSYLRKMDVQYSWI